MPNGGPKSEEAATDGGTREGDDQENSGEGTNARVKIEVKERTVVEKESMRE